MLPSISVALTGAPGTGKSSVAGLAKSSGWEIISVENLAEMHGLLGPLDLEEQAKEIDIENLSKTVGQINGPLIIDGHLSHHLEVDAVVILRCEPSILRERLEQRDYPEWKIVSNVEWELMGGTWSEIQIQNVAEFDTSFSGQKDVWESIQQWINLGFPAVNPFIDWMND